MAGSIAKYHCNYCEEDITNVRVKCSECTDFDLCLQCFSCGAEIGSHKSRHSYQLIDCGTFPIFTTSEKWRALDEIALLEAIEQYGFGNWTDIADSVGIKDLTAQEAKDHYSNYYVLGSIGRATWTRVENDSYAMRDHTCPNNCPLSPGLTTPLAAITDVSQKDEDALGYLPKRDDFEREYDNECESLVSTLSMSGTDEDELESNLKLAQISMYRKRLMERFRKKHVAREYGLVSQFFKSHNSLKEQTHTTPTHKNYSNNVNKKKSLPTQETEPNISPFEDKFKPLLRFESYEENRELFQNLQREKEIKFQIKELMRLRKNGLKRLNECSAFESARSKREKRKENKKKSIPNANIGSAHKRLLGTATRGSAETKDTKDANDRLPHSAKKGSGKESSELTHKNGTKLKNNFDISSLPGCRLLSEREKKLCASMRLRPSQYITLKTLILKDHSQKRKGITSGKSSLENIDKSLRRKIVNFMVKSGWIPS